MAMILKVLRDVGGDFGIVFDNQHMHAFPSGSDAGYEKKHGGTIG